MKKNKMILFLLFFSTGIFNSQSEIHSQSFYYPKKPPPLGMVTVRLCLKAVWSRVDSLFNKPVGLFPVAPRSRAPWGKLPGAVNKPPAMQVVVDSPLNPGSTEEVIEYIGQKTISEIIREKEDVSLNVDLNMITNALWDKYIDAIGQDLSRKQEHENRALSWENYTMRFSLDTIGSRPSDGYPLYIALHGGGGAAPSVNDSQWQQMQAYYKGSITNGVYIAPRGVTDTWNLHFVDASYKLYDRLIENMIAFEGVDSNRVYLLGFSAGGDGVYQITPRMADRWAAVNMSAGHPNGINPENLNNVPFLLQMGEYDSAYNRNIEAVNFFERLKNLQKNYTDGYISELFLHYEGSHNSWRDNDAAGRQYTVMADPITWRDQNNRQTVLRNTNAIQWLNRYTRNPLPHEILWNIKTGADRSRSNGAAYAGVAEEIMSPLQYLFYWIDVGQDAAPAGMLKASYIFDQNTHKNRVIISQMPESTHLRILVHSNLFQLDQPIQINIVGHDMSEITITPNIGVMARTLLERGDINYCYQAEIVLESDQTGIWSVTQPAPGNKGDANNDGNINIIDALFVAQYYVGLNPNGINTYRADTDCNGKINIVDALIIAQYYVGLITDFCQGSAQ